MLLIFWNRQFFLYTITNNRKNLINPIKKKNKIPSRVYSIPPWPRSPDFCPLTSPGGERCPRSRSLEFHSFPRRGMERKSKQPSVFSSCPIRRPPILCVGHSSYSTVLRFKGSRSLSGYRINPGYRRRRRNRKLNDPLHPLCNPGYSINRSSPSSLSPSTTIRVTSSCLPSCSINRDLMPPWVHWLLLIPLAVVSHWYTVDLSGRRVSYFSAGKFYPDQVWANT